MAAGYERNLKQIVLIGLAGRKPGLSVFYPGANNTPVKTFGITGGFQVGWRGWTINTLFFAKLSQARFVANQNKAQPTHFVSQFAWGEDFL